MAKNGIRAPPPRPVPFLKRAAVGAAMDKTNQAAKEGGLLEPGTPLAYSEELLPGANTYDDGTQIRAAVFGAQHVDPETMAVSVRPAGREVATIEKGDIVVGQVTYIKPEALASVKILAVRGKEGRSLLQSVEGTLHVSKIDARYIKFVDEEYRGDLIRAKVIGMKGGPQLATDKPDLGCVKAWSADGVPLVRDGNRLKDPETGQVHHRKLANDYGSGTV
jgi:exosome complex RNA-binding protein Csl4